MAISNDMREPGGSKVHISIRLAEYGYGIRWLVRREVGEDTDEDINRGASWHGVS